MNTLLEVLTKGTEYLKNKEIAEARRIMELLLSHVLECDRLSLYMQFDKPLAEDKLIPLRTLIQRKAQGEPLQHILGFTDFFGRPFRSDPRALIPRPETEELLELVLQHAPAHKPLNILDMGTGSGIIGITLALEWGERAHVTLVDISDKALSLALENAMSHRVKVNALQGDLFSAFSEEQQAPCFDIIVANLPYIADKEASTLSPEVQRDPATALYGGKKGDEIILQFLQQAPSYLNTHGMIALEIGWNQADSIEKALHKFSYTNITLHSDLAGIPRFPIAFSPLI